MPPWPLGGGKVDPGSRSITAYLWYPASAGAPVTPAPYVPDLSRAKGVLDSDLYASLGRVEAHIVDSAGVAPAPQRFPMLVFSHGALMTPLFYSALVEDLASRGYVVVAPVHDHDALFSVLPDGQVVAGVDDATSAADEPDYPARRTVLFEAAVAARAADLTAALDAVAALDRDKTSRFSGRLDMAHVGAFGHSNGGTAAALTCLMDRRVRACLNIDGRIDDAPFVAGETPASFWQPFMYLAKPLKGGVATDADDDALMRSVKGGSYRVLVAGASRESFSDLPFVTAAPDDRGPAERMVSIVRTYVAAFFDKYLRGQKAPALDGGASPFKDVSVEKFGPPSK